MSDATASAAGDEVRDLVRLIREERAAAQAKDRGERWTRYVSLTIVAMAVATAIGSLRAGSFSSKTILAQAQASDMWAFYQAKSIKLRIAEMEARSASGESAQKMNADIERYRREEQEIKAKADGFEKTRDETARHGPPLAFGIASLQIAIALASISLITRRKALWIVAGVLGAIGVGYVGYGLYLV